MIKELLYYIEGLDESILKLNPYLVDSGFEFVPYNLEKFEKTFRDLFPIREDYYEDKSSKLPTLSFLDGLWNSRYFNHWEICKNKYVIFLNDKSLYKSIYDENIAEKGKLSDDIDNEVNELIKKLKLFKKEHIKLLSSFEFKTDDQEILRCNPVSYSSPLAKNKINKQYHLDDNNIVEFQTLKIPESIPSYLELAFKSFFESYNIEDGKLKFVILMICLESIFIISKKDITKTLSQNVSFVISKNKKEFDRKKQRIEILYDLRSKILHGEEEHKFQDGDKLKNEIKKYKKRLKCISIYISATEEIVRNVLKELILNSEYFKIESKKELGHYLDNKDNHLK